MAISFIKAGDGTISAFIAGKSYVVPTNHQCYNDVLEALKKDDEQEFIKFADLKQRVESFGNNTSVSTSNFIEVKGDTVYYKGKELHNVITNKILSYIREGLNHNSLINFLNKLMKNPSKHSVDQLYNFLENKFLPIHEDGDFFGYKRVRNDYLDFHSGTILNKVGTSVEVERNSVDDDYSVDCSYGLHVGSRDYVKNFHGSAEDSRVLLVKVNPADVVSVPKYDVTKMRVCKYFVFEELDNKDFGIDATVYSPEPTSSFVVSNEEDDWDNEDFSINATIYFPKPILSDEEIEDDWDNEDEEDEDFFNDEDNDDEDESLGVSVDSLDYSDVSEWIEEISQGSVKEDLYYACGKALKDVKFRNHLEAFQALCKFVYTEGNQSLMHFLNKTEVRDAYCELYSVEF